MACLDLAWPNLNLLSAMVTNVQGGWARPQSSDRFWTLTILSPTEGATDAHDQSASPEG
jgi:hypothetical protein